MTTETETRSGGAHQHLITAAIAVGALVAGVLFRLVVGDAAVVFAPLLAVIAVVWAWRHKVASSTASAEDGDA